MVGTTLAHYRIAGLLGRGGMGEVYLAEDARLHRRIALKLLPAEAAADADRLERFRREACAVAALSHPNIVTIHSVEQVDGVHFLTSTRWPSASAPFAARRRPICCRRYSATSRSR